MTKNDRPVLALGKPGIPPRWTSSAKSGIGTAIGNESRVWFTLSHGILNEIYYPDIDRAAIRDMGLIVTDGVDYFSEEKRDTESVVSLLVGGLPAFRLVNSSRDGRYRITKEVIADPQRDCVLQKVRFEILRGEASDYQVFVLLAPHLGDQGSDNTSWTGVFREVPLLLASRDDSALALACSLPWLKRSAGYVGVSDGWQDLKEHKTMATCYELADHGNTALTAQIDLSGSKEFVLSLGFGKDAEEAACSAIDSLGDGFDKARDHYIAGWVKWRQSTDLENIAGGCDDSLTAISLSVLRMHKSKTVRGAFIASLSIPWGFSKGDKDQAGYHVTWVRDLVEIAGGLVAAGAREDVLDALVYLQATQLPDGHWPQNMWLDGSAYWDGIQMDETALPILLINLAQRKKMIDVSGMRGFWPMVRAAAGYIARNGPVSREDRWEEDPGYTTFTIAAEIAGLLAAATMAELNEEQVMAAYLRELADTWNDCLDSWLYVSGTDWAGQLGVKGYYVRIVAAGGEDGLPDFQRNVKIKNVAAGSGMRLPMHLVSPDALSLVRFGLRAAGDARISDTVKVIDHLLKIDTPVGPVWHRYNDDGYGEYSDGSPFDGEGVGRGWPLLTGERAHFELMAGHRSEARRMAVAMACFANRTGLLPEQVWDSPDIPEKGLYFGRPTGSAMPLAWAHAEYLKLMRSLQDGYVFDLPPETIQRYLVEKTVSTRRIWRFSHRSRIIPAGKNLRIEVLAAAVIRWTRDDWRTFTDVGTKTPIPGLHFADLATENFIQGSRLSFTFHWQDANCWEGKNFSVEIG